MKYSVNSFYKVLKTIASFHFFSVNIVEWTSFVIAAIASFLEGFSGFMTFCSKSLMSKNHECNPQNVRLKLLWHGSDRVWFWFWRKKMHSPRMLPILWGFCTFKTWFPSWKFFRIHICELDIGGLCLKSWQIWPWAKMASRNSHLVRWAVRTAWDMEPHENEHESCEASRVQHDG